VAALPPRCLTAASESRRDAGFTAVVDDAPVTVVDLRPATAADDAFCYALHRAAMRPYVEAVWGWDEDVQRAFHARGFDSDRTRIVVVDGVDVGALIVDDGPELTYLARIEILPSHQGRGIGGRLVGGLLRDAAARGRAVELDVLAVNDRAHALYRRLGFRDVGRHGDDNVKIRMRYVPGVTAGPASGARPG
jgi:ribosomal protein S18 acetylase RimI-like enzyme